MYFSSLIFMFLYLPVVLGGYYLLPRKYRNFFLFVVNLVFYGWGEPQLIFLMLFAIFFSWTMGWLIEKYRSRRRLAKGLLAASVVVSLGMLGFYKYADFLLGILRNIPGLEGLPSVGVSLPIGISFYIFQTMSYTIDVYREDTPAQHNPIAYGTYVSFFPQLIAGPIVRYRDIADQLKDRKETPDAFADGIRLFVIGLAKKVLLANQMGVLWDNLWPSASENGLLGVWLGAAAFMLQISFDFAGYSDMARGLGQMFGFRFLKNFDYPYTAVSITDFWRRWHISLSTWFRDYVYIPLGGSRKGMGRTLCNLLIVWFLTGLWHGASYNFILWGLYYFVLLAFEKLFLGKWLKKLPKAVGHIYTLFFVLIGWVLFYFEDLGHMVSYLQLMFIMDAGVLSGHARSMLLSYLPLLLIAIAACLPVWKQWYFKLSARSRHCWIETVVCAVVLLLCTASLVSQSYNPFLYFRF